jgi:Glycosyltransferases involved in cell wall biogenesis
MSETEINKLYPQSFLISVVFPVYNEEENLIVLHKQVRSYLLSAGVNYEMIFVDNGSDDNSLYIIKNLLKEDSCVKYISLSRNFGHQNALFAGMCQSRGDAIITMDADLQHPPSLLPIMIDCWKTGVNIVYTSKRNTDLPRIKKMFIQIFYFIISKISGLKIGFGESDFRLIDKKVWEIIRNIPEYHKFFRGLVKWIGFKSKEVLYDVGNRYCGKSKFSYGNLISFALDGIISFSRYPLRLLTLFGFFIFFSSILYIIWICIASLAQLLSISFLKNIFLPPGWATLTVAILFLGSIQLIAIGILGEYIGRIFDQVKGRPNYIINEKS